jgi:hypothetical protein
MKVWIDAQLPPTLANWLIVNTVQLTKFVVGLKPNPEGLKPNYKPIEKLNDNRGGLI